MTTLDLLIEIEEARRQGRPRDPVMQALAQVTVAQIRACFANIEHKAKVRLRHRPHHHPAGVR